MIARRSVIHPTGVVKRSRAPVFLPFGIVLTALVGCSSSHTLELSALQPVYFGSAPESLLPLDSAHVRVVREFVASTSHVSEKERVVYDESTSFAKDASERVEGDVAEQLGKALENDSDRFVGTAQVRAVIRASIPWDTYLTDLLGLVFIKNPLTEGSGQKTSETIEISGTMYKVRRTGQ
jgi:fumarylacetoacetate (FAA) hydrolase family protein